MQEKYDNPNFGEHYKIRDIVIVFFGIMTAFFGFGNLPTPLQVVNKGREAAHSIYEILEEVPKIKEDQESHFKPLQIHGHIEFRNIQFSYPTHSNVRVLNDINMKIVPGQKVAFVGETGCGKSTLLQLIERFYDPTSGEVKIDGKNLKDYNLKAVRQFIGFVGQEPVLFAMSVKENLLLAKRDATDKEIQAALEKANAWEFVQGLEKKLDTYVGMGGCQLSGGQKQRIAIARAILQNPSILLLDESTSALDRKNEKQIQDTLDNFSKDRTTITIAHRLSTIKNSDVIFILDGGAVKEFGSHEELMQNVGGPYYNYVKKQDVLSERDQEQQKFVEEDKQDIQLVEGCAEDKAILKKDSEDIKLNSHRKYESDCETKSSRSKRLRELTSGLLL